MSTILPSSTEIGRNTGSGDNSRISKRTRRMVWMSVGGVFLDGYDISIISIAILQIKVAFHPNAFELGLIASATLWANFVGALVFGHIADRIGRKAVFLINVTIFVLFALLSGLSQNIWELIASRAILGIGIGADYAIASVAISEILPIKNRGRILTWNWGIAWLAGELASFVVGYLLLRIGPDAWRWMLASGAIPAVVVLIARRKFVESPKWLAQKGRIEEAVEHITALGGDAYIDITRNAGVGSGAKHPGVLSYYKDLLGPAWRQSTVFAFVNYFCFSLVFYSTGVFLPLILAANGFSKTISGIALGNLEIQATAVLGLIVCLALIETWGRVWLNIIGFFGANIGLLIFIVEKKSHVGTIVAFVIVLVSLWMGPALMDNLFLGELWPTRLRATGAGLGASAGRLSSALIVLFGASLIASFGVDGLVGISSFFAVTAILNSSKIGIEMKGKPLCEEGEIINVEQVELEHARSSTVNAGLPKDD